MQQEFVRSKCSNSYIAPQIAPQTKGPQKVTPNATKFEIIIMWNTGLFLWELQRLTHGCYKEISKLYVCDTLVKLEDQLKDRLLM